ncbi:MAG: hypothetical protein ACE366_15980 [Bradymonadia bacterium]
MNHPATARTPFMISRRLWATAMCLMLLCLQWSPAGAQACPEGNVLKDIKAKSSRASSTQRIADGVASNEGDPWNTQLSAILNNAKSEVTYDLGAVTQFTAALVQADNNDVYTIEVSNDGDTWQTLWAAQPVPQAGMRTRSAKDLLGEGRYLRVKASGGDKSYSIGEMQVFCKTPAQWPPALERKKGKAKADPGKLRLRRLAKWKAGIGVLGFFMLLISFSVRKKGDGPLGNLAPFVEGVLGVIVFVSLFFMIEGPDPKAFMLWPLSVAAWLGVVYLAGALLLKNQLSPWFEIGITLATGVALWFTYHAEDRNDELPWPLIAAALGIIAMLGLWLSTGRKFHRPTFDRLQRPILMGVLTVMATLAWTNFWTFHGWRAVHMHDTFHYYMGAKYFPENRYTKLYHCAAIAELEDGRKAQVKKRKIRDLVDNSLGPSERVTTRPEICTEAFTSNERWEMFKADLRYFRGNMGSKYWDKIFGDHGYNASPVWTMTGKLFADIAHVPIEPRLLELSKKLAANGKLPGKEFREFNSLTKERNTAMDVMIQRLALIDGLLYAAVFILFGWAFGWRVMAVAALCWGAGYPWAYFWTGGAYMRIPWLFTAVAGICFLKKKKHFVGGFFLMWSLLLRAFPGGLIVGLAVKILIDMIRGRDAETIAAEQNQPGRPLSKVAAFMGPLKGLIDRIQPKHQRLITGTFAAIAVLVTLSLPSNDGLGSYKEFWENSQKHVATPLTNHMGLPTIMSYHPDKVGRELRKGNLQDPWKVWKVERIKTRKLWWRRGIYIGLLGLFVGLLAIISQRFKEDWVVASASAIMVLGIFELTSYYYVFMILFAPLVGRSPLRLAAYISTAVVGQIIFLNVGWYDEQYTFESMLMLVGVLLMLFDLIGQGRNDLYDDPEDDPPKVEQSDDPVSLEKEAEQESEVIPA